MIAQPGVRVVEYPASKAIRVTWDHILDGKPSPLKRCRVRLGRGDKKEKITWTTCLDCRGNYQGGHIEEFLEETDIPKEGRGKNVYAQFLLEPVHLLNDETGKIEENDEREVICSNVAPLISLATAAKYKTLNQNAMRQSQIRPGA